MASTPWLRNKHALRSRSASAVSSATSAVPPRAYGAVTMPPPQAATRPCRIGGIAMPIAAAAIAAGLWAWTIPPTSGRRTYVRAVSYTHLRAHETRHDLVCRLLLEKKKKTKHKNNE